MMTGIHVMIEMRTKNLYREKDEKFYKQEPDSPRLSTW